MGSFLVKGKTLLVSGPASVVVTSGKIVALGFRLPIGKKVVVRKNKAIPLEAEENSTLEILSNDSALEEIEGSTIPDSWKAAIDYILEMPSPCTILVLGDTDRGKNTFCLFQINRALSTGLKPFFIDSDVGQSEMSPPTTIGLSHISEPTLDLFSRDADNTFFIGDTSPNGVVSRILDGLTFLKRSIAENPAPFLVINTDGWVRGELAIDYKTELIRSLNPEAVVAIQSSDELEPLLTAVGLTTKVLRVASSPIVKKRDREDRKELREQGYKKILENAAMRRLPMNWSRFELTMFGSGSPLSQTRLNDIENVLCRRVLYGEESEKEFLIVIVKEDIDEAQRISIPKDWQGKSLHIINEDELKGLLIGLLDERRRFLGLGIISKVEYEDRVLKIVTPCREKVSIIQFGQVRLNRNGREMMYTETTLE